MIKLDLKDYYKVKKPLSELNFNTMFAEFVVNKDVAGDIYVDDIHNPTVFYVIHPYGMSLLFGDWSNESEWSALKDCMTNKNKHRAKAEWMQVYPKQWENVIDNVLGDKLISCNELDESIDVYKYNEKAVKSTRYNFAFNYDRHKDVMQNINLSECTIIPMTREMFDSFEGSVIPKVFWDNSDEFQKAGKGYCLMQGDEIASVAFSSYTAPGKLEIGIETAKSHRKKGYAFLSSSKLIEYCIENNLEPVWSCNGINSGSIALALKLGFDRTITLPYYRLKV